jgi:hypothetical protein
MRVYRSARVRSPHLGRLSFWTTSLQHARWFQGWERQEWERGRLPYLTADDIPSAIYRAEIRATAVVYDGRIFARPPHLSPEDVMAKCDELRALGIDWVLVTEGPIDGEMWTVAIYLGDDPVSAERESDAAMTHDPPDP